MKTEILSRKVDRKVILIEPGRIHQELKDVGLGSLTRAEPQTIEEIRGAVMYEVPILTVFEFENFLVDHLEAKKVNDGTSSNRHAIYFLEKAMIKSSKKGMMISYTNDKHPGNIALRRARAIDEFVDAYTKADALVWRPISLVESQEIEKNEPRNGEIYLVFRRPIRFPAVSGELKPGDFESQEFYEKAMNGYKNFISKVDDLGFVYSPIHKIRPYDDLYMRVNKKGNVEVFANDFAHLHKKK